MRGHGNWHDVEMDKMVELDRAGADLLRYAIIEQAIVDYTHAKKIIARMGTDVSNNRVKDAIILIEELEKFFLDKNGLFSVLCDLDGKMILDTINNGQGTSKNRVIKTFKVGNKNGLQGKDNTCEN